MNDSGVRHGNRTALVYVAHLRHRVRHGWPRLHPEIRMFLGALRQLGYECFLSDWREVAGPNGHLKVCCDTRWRVRAGLRLSNFSLLIMKSLGGIMDEIASFRHHFDLVRSVVS